MTDKMLEHTRAQLSALFDGELGRDEARFLRKRLEHDVELAAYVSRWQLAGDILRGQATAAAPAGFAAGVAAAVAADVQSAPAAAAASRTRRWIPGAALAASVAVVAMFMARQSPDLLPAEQPAPVEMASTAPAPALPAPVQDPAPATPQLPDAAAQLAAATVAAVEVPRRAAARRASSSRGQAQRAAATRTARVEQLQVAAVAGSGIAGTSIASADATNPFAPEATTIASRPWPRALLPNASSAFNVGYGELQPVMQFQNDAQPSDAHPFRPAPQSFPQGDQPE